MLFLQTTPIDIPDVPAWAEWVGAGGVTSFLLYVFGRLVLAVPNMYVRTMGDLRTAANEAIVAQRETSERFLEFLQTTQALTTEALVRTADQMTTLTRETRMSADMLADHNRRGDEALSNIIRSLDDHRIQHDRSRWSRPQAPRSRAKPPGGSA